jgi:hypothetical protein
MFLPTYSLSHPYKWKGWGRCFFEQQFPDVIFPVFIIGISGIPPDIPNSASVFPFRKAFSPYSGKTSTIVLKITRFSAFSVIGGYIAAGNNR